MHHPTLRELYAAHTGKVSDKWSSYLVEYERLFAACRDEPVRVLEIGVQNGGSLEIWAKYFANATVVIGCDIDPNCGNLSFDDPRISVVVGDASNDTTSQYVFQRCSQFDIVIDDGSHRSSDIVKALARYLPHLADAGVFVVEDLHCSYWQEYEGGLFEPYSAMTFCKRLADIISHEHWGVPKTRESLLAGFNKKFGISFDEAALARVHSVEFINSMCVVGLSEARSNRLGQRFIAGQDESVAQGHFAARGKPSVSPDQSSNTWSARALPPDEELRIALVDLAERGQEVANLSAAAAERDARIASLNHRVGERDQQVAELRAAAVARERQMAELNRAAAAREQEIGNYHDAVVGRDEQIKALKAVGAARDATISEIYSSTSWRVTKPLRFLSRTLIKALNALRRADIFGKNPKTNATDNSCAVGPSDGPRSENENELFLRQIVTIPNPLDQDRIGTDKPILIIIPIYLGLAETRRCIESVINSTNNASFEILLINDCSPEPEMQVLLDSFAGAHRNVRVMRNKKNLGFVKTVNAGMMSAREADVVLLNSDTEVANDWLDRLVHHAYKDERIATVTPFSNNATICNYPDLDGWSRLPVGESAGTLDAACASANGGLSVDIPTAVGFCMYIKRSCINRVGRFDEKAFGKGYGEENDFCMKATKSGWRHVLAADVFVFHKGEISFGTSAPLGKSNALKVLVDRYPEYERLVDLHIRQNAAYPYRVRATAARYRTGERPVILYVTHNAGGGTEKHIRELATYLANQARILTLRPVPGDSEDLLLEGLDKKDKLSFGLSSTDTELLVRVLKSFGVARAHIHHTMGFSFSIESLITRLGVPYDLTLHDYHQLCPRINLFQPGRGYCGDPDPHECNACILKAPAIGSESEIVWWRSRGQSLVTGADRVICPSDDARTRLVNYFPGARALTVPHEESVVQEKRIEVPRPAARDNRLVAILGELAPHKGMQLVAGVLDAIHRENLAIEILLIGSSEGGLPTRVKYSETGAYEDEELPAILHRVSPDIFLFAAQAQETYSYTLSAAIRSGRPIIVTNVGALPERVRDVPNAVVVPSDVAPSELASLLANMQLRFFDESSAARPEMNSFYKSRYLAAPNDSQSGDRRPVVAVIPEMMSGHLGQVPSPCAYIRLLIPMSAPDFQRAYEVHFVTLENALQMRADVFVTQRLAVKNVPDIDRLRTHADRVGARIIYDIDDYLIGLPAEHPESLHYADSAALVVKSLAIADETWASTDALMREVAPISRSVKLVANELSASVLGTGLTRNNDEQARCLRILYMGTATHGPDLETVLMALRVLHAEREVDFELHLVGVVGAALSDPWIRRIDIPAPADSYPMFMNWLMSLPAYDIGIAPLNDNLFNRCKSAIKYFDYTQLGLVTIASDLEPYRCIIDGENGFLASNTTLGWCDSIRRAYAERSRFDQILTRARDSIRDLYEVARANRVRIEGIATLESSSNGARAKSKGVVQSTNLNRELLAAAFLHGNGIEIGALHSPLKVPSNAVVQYVDRLPAEGLAEHYPEIPSSSFVKIDIIDDGEALSKICTGTKDFVVANHFIEHAEDPIATIQTFLRVLRTGGVVFLAVPDKRATFDKDRELTPLAHLINDHSQGGTTSRQCHYEEWVKFVEPNFGRSYDDPSMFSSRVHDLMTQRYSIHFHCWEPSAFMEMLDYLRDNMRWPFEVSIFVEREDEFVVVLNKTPPMV